MTLISGTLITISSTSWISAWVGLELNLMSFIPLIIKKDNQYSSEATLKYFLVQALGSSILIFSIILSLLEIKVTHSIMLYALLLKLGAAPFHFWFPQVINGLLWSQIIVLITVQKAAPLFLLSCVFDNDLIIAFIFARSVLSARFGALGGINQTSFRKVLAFSSINHVGWLLASVIINEYILVVYFLFYCFISGSIVLIFSYFQLFQFNQLINLLVPSEVKLLSIFSFLSLGGLPPFTGFVPKWIIIQKLADSLNMFLLVILLTSALVTLYFYLRISISSLSLRISFLKAYSIRLSSFSTLVFFLVFVNFFGLLFPFFTIY